MTTPQDPNQQGAGQYPAQPHPHGQDPVSDQYPQPDQYPQQGQYPQPGQYPHQGQYPQQGQDPQQPYAGQYPPPPGSPAGPVPSKSALPRVLIAALVAVAVALGVFLFIQNRNSDPTTAGVGECLKVEGATTVGNPKSEQIDCADPEAQFKVAATGLSATCESLELTYQQYRDNDESDVTSTVCLRPNFEVGECYVEPEEGTTLPKVGPCDAVDGTVKAKVESLNENTSDTSVCSTPELSYTYATRDLVVCFSAVP